MTGWGQEGPVAQRAGHDINFLAVTGALAAMGKTGEPAMPPLNLVGDFGGGSMLLAFGVMAALWERERSGKGQVVDAAIVDGVASRVGMICGSFATGPISIERDRNLLSGAAPFYRCYICADGKEAAVGAIEPKFYRELLQKIGAPAEFLVDHRDSGNWKERSKLLEELSLKRTTREWCDLLQDCDACLAPVLDLTEEQHDDRVSYRSIYVEREGVLHPAPVPRFSRTPGAVQVSR